MNSTLAPIACVVTATTWDRTENRGPIARQQKNAGRKTITNPIEPIVTQQVALIGHLSNDCPRIHDPRTEVVGLDVPLDSPDAGLPCDYCAVPNLHLVRDAAEVDAVVHVHGTGDDYLDDTDDNPNVVVVPPARPTHRPNKFAGTCRTCGTSVAAGAGRIERSNDGWLVFHLDGECPAPATTPSGTAMETAPPSTATRTTAPSSPLPAVPEGYYALDGTEHANNATVFYAVDRPTEGKWAGRVFVKQIVGGDRGDRVPRNAVPTLFARIIEAGIAESQARYGREIGRCGVCNRTLTDDESRRLGIGPVCRKGGRD